MKLKYFLSDLMFLRTYNSPFKPLKLSWYVGKTAIGLPYFLPRRWKKFSYKDCLKKTEEHLEKHPQSLDLVPFDKLVDSYKVYSKPVPLKIGFNYCGLGWKTKWTESDFRFEWSPRFSFVAFGYQLCLTFVAPEMDHYWECWLYYDLRTDKTKSTKERIEQCKKENPQIWTYHNRGKEEKIDYYQLVLKSKYATRG